MGTGATANMLSATMVNASRATTGSASPRHFPVTSQWIRRHAPTRGEMQMWMHAAMGQDEKRSRINTAA